MELRSAVTLPQPSLLSLMNKAFSTVRSGLMQPLPAANAGIPRSSTVTNVTTSFIAKRSASALPTIQKKKSSKIETLKANQAKANAAVDFKARIEKLPQLRFPSRYKVECLSTSAEADHHIREMLKNDLDRVFGMDLEWQPTFKKGGKEKKTALVQICGEKNILLIQVSTIKFIPTMLRQFLEDRNILKTGINIRADGLKMFRDFGIRTNGLLELSTLAEASGSPKLQITHLRSLRAFTALFLDRNMPKGKVRLSNWGRPTLSESQQFYAANDAYASYEIYRVLESIMREQEETSVELSAIHHLEDQLQLTKEAEPKVVPTFKKAISGRPPQLNKATQGIDNRALPLSTTTIIRKAEAASSRNTD